MTKVPNSKSNRKSGDGSGWARQSLSVTCGTTTDAANGKPKKPLSAFNIYFQWERNRILNGTDFKGAICTPQEIRQLVHEYKTRGKRAHRRSHGKIGFHDLAKTVAHRWKHFLDDKSKHYLEEQAAIEKAEYLERRRIWEHKQHKLKSAKKGNSNKNSSSLPISRDSACSSSRSTTTLASFPLNPLNSSPPHLSVAAPSPAGGRGQQHQQQHHEIAKSIQDLSQSLLCFHEQGLNLCQTSNCSGHEHQPGGVPHLWPPAPATFSANAASLQHPMVSSTPCPGNTTINNWGMVPGVVFANEKQQAGAVNIAAIQQGQHVQMATSPSSPYQQHQIEPPSLGFTVNNIVQCQAPAHLKQAPPCGQSVAGNHYLSTAVTDLTAFLDEDDMENLFSEAD